MGTDRESTARGVATGAGFIVMVVGAGHVLAWVSGLMTRVPASTIIMKTNAGLGLFMSGLALVLLAPARLSRQRRRPARVLAVLVFVVGLATLAEHVAGWNLHIDQMLAHEHVGAAATTSPNRMGPPGSVSFVLLGISLLFLSSVRRRSLHEPFALLAGLLGLLAVIGYLYDANELYAVARLTAIAWPTAVSILVLSIGVLCARPGEGLMSRLTADDPGGTIARALLGPIIVVPLVFGWVRLVGERLGWFDAAIGTGVTMLLFIVTFSSLLLFASRRLGAAAEARKRADVALAARAAEQQALLAALADKAAELERDIAERARVEEALRGSEEKFAKAFHGNTAAMAITRLDDGRYIEVNDRFSAVTGYSREQAVGHTTAELNIWKHAADRDAFVGALRRHRVVRNVECHFVRPNGEEWIALVSSQVSQIEGHDVLISSFSDITEGKRAEQALRDSEEALREANVRLAEADRRKDEFLAVLSHELRNPLAPVRAALYVLEHGAAGEEQASRARAVIDRQIAQLSRLVDDLLDVTRITRGKIALRREPVELNGLIARTAEDHRELFRTTGLVLIVSPCSEPLWVNGDVQRLAQVVGNLLHNATKFTGAGGVTTVRVSKDETTQTAAITVTDTGIGISQAALPHLFEPFVQVDSTIDRARGGLGLGLSLVKSLAEMHGGTASVRSDGIGRGAEFTVRLPLQTAPTVADDRPAAGERASRRIFIIEDNVDAAETLREALQVAGHEVEVAYSAADALGRIRAFRPEIVLCDIGLPGMNGYDVARALRKDDATSSAYLIALTGYALPEDVARAREAGFDLHVAKPPDPHQLQEVLAAARPGPTRGSAN